MGKKRGKHILMPPFGVDWPKVDKDTEDKIITALTLKLQEFPSLESKRTKDGRQKAGQPDPIPHPKLTQGEEEKLKARLRQQLVIGHRQVTKALEWNQVALVLASGDTQPPILLRSLLPLVASRRCPGICVSSLNPWLTDAVGVTSILAMGFKKRQPGEPNDFEEFVTMASALAPPLSVPWAKQTPDGSSGVGDGDCVETESMSSSGGSVQKNGSTLETSSPAKDWLLMEPDQEREVVDKLLELVKPYEALFQKPRSKYTPEELQTRKTINSCMMLDLAAVRNAACGEQLELLLVQNEGSTPHPILVSAVNTATEKGCPVLHMASLKKELCAFVRDSHLRAVGFKKSQGGSIKQPEAFRQFVAMASQYAPATHHPPPISSQPKDGSLGQEKSTQPASTDKKRKQKPASPIYDVSSLYVYKKNEDENVPDSGTETQKESGNTSETYISLSSEPTVQYLGVKSPSDGTTLSDIAFVDSTAIPKKRLITEKPVETEEADLPKDTSAGFMGVMGMDAVDAPVAVSQPLYHEPRGKKSKVNLKRAMDQSADRGEFVSFKIRPTNVQLSVPNPSKKKQKKKFKKK